MSEEIVKAAGFLRKNGGYSLTVTPSEAGFIVTGFFKDIGSYGTTVSYAASGIELNEAQNACITELAKLVHYTQDSKPNKDKPSVAAPTGGAVVSLSGLDDTAWSKAKDMVKAAGFKYDKDSKNWIGGNINELPDWLKKRTKGSGSNGNGSYKKAAPKPEPAEEASDDIPFGGDELPF